MVSVFRGLIFFYSANRGERRDVTGLCRYLRHAWLFSVWAFFVAGFCVIVDSYLQFFGSGLYCVGSLLLWTLSSMGLGLLYV